MSQPGQRTFQEPRWAGQPLAEKTIFVFAEQGFGDNFQFIRYTSHLKDRGANVFVECQKPLMRIIGSCPFIDQLIAAGDELPRFDYQVPLMSLPGIFKTKLDTMPAKVPYLFADS